MRSWNSSTKYVVIESDDWGSIRMPSKGTLDQLKKRNFKVLDDPYSRFDCLEQGGDLIALFEVLQKYKGADGNSPIITANTIMANPDFKRIEASGFTEYFYEPFTTTIKRLYGDLTMSNWYEGIRLGLLHPQLHGREHLNVLLWLSELKSGNPELLDAFKHNCFSVPLLSKIGRRRNLMAALDYYALPGEHDFTKNYIVDAADIFLKSFGFSSKSFIAPAYIWPASAEETLAKAGISYLQGIPFQFDPGKGKGFRRRFHFTGQRNTLGQLYLVRNCFFEPSLDDCKDWVDECLHRMKSAFDNRKPAIVGTHRLNFIGGIEPLNRERNLAKLNELLHRIIKEWPDVCFTTSDCLGEMINRSVKADKI